MFFKIKQYIFTFILSVLAIISFAQTPTHKFKRLDISEGLSNSQVNCVLKDSRGFIWIGTLSGLNRFDGSNLKIFFPDIHDTASISDSYIIKISEDFTGNLIIQTRNGINIFDPGTETFSHDIDAYLKQYSIPQISFTTMQNGNDGSLWITTNGQGMFAYFPKTKKTLHFIHNENDSNSIASNTVANLTFDKNQNLWIVHKNGLIEMFDYKNNKVLARYYFLYNPHRSLSTEYNYSLFFDSKNKLWINLITLPEGVYCFNPATNEVIHFCEESSKYKIKSNLVSNCIEDNKGNIWVGTDHGGINLIDNDNFAISSLLNNPFDRQSLSQNSVTTVYKDNQDIIWIGTFRKGINYYHEKFERFKVYKHNPNDKQSLTLDDINCISEDDKGNLWIGTNGGGLNYFDHIKETFSNFRHKSDNPNSISSDIIVDLHIDKEKKLWIGTYFGGLNYFDGKKFVCYRHEISNPKSLADNRPWRFLEDSQNRFWIGTNGGGVDLFDRKTQTFKHFKLGEPNSVHGNYIAHIIEDNRGNIWFANSDGIDVLEKSSNKFVNYVKQNKNSESLSCNNVNYILQDSRGLIWIATRDGLNLFDVQRKTFKVYKVDDGLPNNTIHTLAEDNNHRIWIGTTNGLSCMTLIADTKNPNQYIATFHNFDESDGLQSKEFNENSVCKTHSGELYFGGPNGLNMFKPDQMIEVSGKINIVLTDFQIFNKSLKANVVHDGRTILNQSIGFTNEIVLKHSENMFSIEFAGIDLFNSNKTKYTYKLDGFTKEWLTTDVNQRKITYTNLDPGDYTFRIKVAGLDDKKNQTEVKLHIKILPPFWNTGVAKIIYILIVIGILFWFRRWLILKERQNYQKEQERQEELRRLDLDMMKIKFFTNISHEFRTPLTLILTPLERIISKAHETEFASQLIMIHRNAKRLLNLVNQLLDFRKLEIQTIPLTPSHGDIVKFVKETVYSFNDVSENKRINMTFQTEFEEFYTLFDHDKLEKILFNLLSNAFKFTPEKGSVTVSIKFAGSNNEQIKEGETKVVQLIVSDTGLGIAKEKHEKIFERFFQNEIPGTIMNQGTGIGLSIVKEFVKIHNGTIDIDSEPNKGTSFTIDLPLVVCSHTETGIAGVVVEKIPNNEILSIDENEETTEKTSSGKPTLLLIEDNEDFRFYLKDNLKEAYQIFEAKDGKEGWQLAISQVPDLIVSDIMMPALNGLDLCKKIKNDVRVSHIPVILLTARTSDQQKIEGYQSGADAYITKPFNYELLLSRIHNLIHLRKKLHKNLKKHLEINPSEITINSLDEKLIAKALCIVEKNIENADFSVEDLSKEIGISRVHLYKKLLAVTGKTPIEFIRIIRLKRAAQLLEKSKMSVSEIAYKVGFNTPRYFTKYFLEEFNVLPSVYAKSRQKEN